MRTEEIGAKVGAERCSDGKAHTGKRKVSFAETVEEITKWVETARAECKKFGVEFGPAQALGVLEAGYRLFHQRDMGQRLLTKYGKQEQKTGRVRDLSDAEAL